MQTGTFLLAYFGPEVQLPLVSVIGAISGVVLLVGGARSGWSAMVREDILEERGFLNRGSNGSDRMTVGHRRPSR